MKTYSISSSIGIFQLPNEIDNLDDAIQYVENNWANSGKIRLVEHTWTCVSQTPFMIDTDY